MSMGTPNTGNVTATVTSDEVVETGLVTATVTASEVVGTGIVAATVTLGGAAKATVVTSLTRNVTDFMSRVVPWPVNSSGYVNLHCSMLDLNKNDGSVFFTGKPFQTVDGFVGHAKSCLSKPNVRDIWFCTSLQSQAKENPSRKPTVVRFSRNALLLKAIWIDVDVKSPDPANPDKHYHTPEEAWAAVCAFRTAAGLPPFTAVVKSGSGLHIYWISAVALTPVEWNGYAQGLRALLAQHGLKCDAGLTTDSARLLRVPETLNYKTDPPKPVELLMLQKEDLDFPTALGFLTTIAPAVKTSSPAKQLFDAAAFAGLKPAWTGEGSLSDRIEREFPPLDPRPAFKECGFLKEAFKTGGKDYDQPMWNLTTLAATFMENGNAFAHEMSKGHPEYTRESTEALWQRKVREQQAGGLGWPSCGAIKANGCKACATCPHFEKIKSPLNLTTPITVAVTPSNPLTVTAPGPVTWSLADLKVSFSNIPHRRWLYGFDLVRGELTVIGSPGGVGKSSLAIGMAISIATGRELLGEKIRGGSDLKVLVINAEDSGAEIVRRVCAFCRAHSVAEQSLGRLLLAGADDPRVQRLSFLQTNSKNLSELDQHGFAVLEFALETFCPDVIVLDPLVAFCAGGNMNDNGGMSLVMRGLKRLAAKFDCAVLIVHHTRKGGDAGDAESISGAAAIVNLARRAIMPVPMTEKEAPKFGVLPSDRFRYFKLVDAKSNLAPRSADSPWYQLHSVELPNPEPPIYPFGDNVQAIARVILPLQNNAAAVAEDQKIQRAILDLVHRGKMVDGQLCPYSPSLAGAENQRALLADAMAAVASATAPQQWTSSDLEFSTKYAIDKMKKENWFIIDDVKKLKPRPASRYRKGRGLAVDWSKTPWPNGGAGDTATSNEQTLDDGQLVNTRSID